MVPFDLPFVYNKNILFATGMEHKAWCGKAFSINLRYHLSRTERGEKRMTLKMKFPSTCLTLGIAVPELIITW